MTNLVQSQSGDEAMDIDDVEDDDEAAALPVIRIALASEQDLEGAFGMR